MGEPSLRHRLIEQLGTLAGRQPFRKLAHALRVLFPGREPRFVGSASLDGTLQRFAGLISAEGDAPTIRVNSPSFLGYHGLLPFYFDDLARDCEKVAAGNTGLRDFLDLFLDPMVRLLCDAQAEPSIPVAYEAARGQKVLDRFSARVLQLLGLFPLPGVCPRTLAIDSDAVVIDPDLVVGYAGLLSIQPPTAAALQSLLGSYFAVPAWVTRCCPCSPSPDPSEPYRFCLWLGPLDWVTYQSFLPVGGALPHLLRLTRLYVGVEYQFHIRLLLRWAEERPLCRLDDERTALLDWTLVLDSDRRPDADPVGIISEEWISRIMQNAMAGGG